jgi:preprotein translocase subunit SecG
MATGGAAGVGFGAGPATGARAVLWGGNGTDVHPAKMAAMPLTRTMAVLIKRLFVGVVVFTVSIPRVGWAKSGVVMCLKNQAFCLDVTLNG